MSLQRVLYQPERPSQWPQRLAAEIARHCVRIDYGDVA
jgi:hypothetical protein